MHRHCIGLTLALVLVCTLIGRAQKPAPPKPSTPPTISGATGGRPAGSGGQKDWTRLRGRVIPPGSLSSLPEYMSIQLVARTGGPPKIEIVRNGTFEFRSVAPGDYQITLEANGFEDVVEPLRVEYFGGPGIQIITLALGKPTGDAEGATPPARNAVVDADFLAAPAKARKELEKAERASDRDQPKKAIKHLEKALAIHPEFYHAQNNLAAQYLKIGRNLEAANLLRASLAIKPTSHASHNLGIALMRSEKIAEAVAPLQQAIELDRRNIGAHRSLGEAYYRIGQYRLALDSFQVASEHDSNADYPLAIGHCFLRLKDFTAALEQYQSFLTVEPPGERADWVRGLVEQIRLAQKAKH